MKKYPVILILLIICCSYLYGQPKSHIEHYNLQEGIPQRIIMDIMQDRKGFIWLATWDGLCKFDGYHFTTFKTYPESPVRMKSNRIDKLVEDHYGYIWVRSYNGEHFRFNPATEEYVATFKSNEESFKTVDILPMASGKVWLTSEQMGAICVSDSMHHFKPFTRESGDLRDNRVYTVFEDSRGSSWILTGNGVVKVDHSVEEEPVLLPEQINDGTESYGFFSAIEMENEIWFGGDSGKIWRYHKEEGSFRPFDLEITSKVISIKKIYDNLFVVLTSHDGFFICDRNLTHLRKFGKENLKALPTNEMLSSYVDSNSNLWLETNSKGIAKFNLINNELKYYLPNDYGNNENFLPGFFIIEDNTGNIWVHPHGGFSYYDQALDKLVPFYNDPYSPDWKFSDVLHHAFLDRQGNIWLSTRSGGLEKVVFDNTHFKLNDFYSNKISITGFEVRSIMEDRNRNIWMGNLSGIISVYDPGRNFKGFLGEDGKVSKTGKSLKTMSYSLMQDKKGNIWMGTKGDGVWLLKPEDSSYTSFEMRQYKHDPEDKYSLSNNIVYSIHEDEEGRIWTGNYGGGVNLFDPVNDRFINSNNRFENYPSDVGAQVRVVKSHKGKIYVGATFGMVVFAVDSQWNITGYKVYSKEYNVEGGLRANDIYDITVTAGGDLYIATFGGGLAKVDSYDGEGFPFSFKTYDTRDGLHSDIVLSIKEDDNRQLWINSEGGLSKFDPLEESFQQFNDVSRAISNQYFTETLPLFTSDGELIYGCVHGTLSFSPDKITTDTNRPYLALTNFKVSNKEYALPVLVDDVTEIILKHNENIFSIEYAALDYINPGGILYAYKLEGFDRDWVNTHEQRLANYTNIPPGKYTFKVRSTNSNRTWVENERSLRITIKPSFWQTRWAYLLYVVSFILVLYSILRTIFLFYRMRDRVLLEQEQTEMKTRFFTDISHEIRTPLTMIVSPIENMLDNRKTDPEVSFQLQLVLKNANRMLKMVNQILDFRKVQKQKLRIKEVAIGGLVEELFNSFFKIAEAQQIRIAVNNSVGAERIWVDTDAFEKMLVNLVSNSVKYSHPGGRVEIHLFLKDKSVAVQVKDEGIGMTKEVVGKLFTRFASYNKDKNKPSTGIGLSIVKEIADKHHARVTVESDVNKGSSFTVLFQTGLEHFRNDPGVEWVQAEEKEYPATIHPPDEQIETETGKDSLSILIVEDDQDLRTFIRSVLREHFEVFEAADGLQGYQAALKYMPDFIVSDVMMPGMDGMEFLRKIRDDRNTSHIPFILLTARTNMDDQLQGINSGANDYITKPFSVKLLKAKIGNIIKQRMLYADYMANQQLPASGKEGSAEVPELVEQVKITASDQQFLRNLQELVTENLDNSDFTIDDLVRSTTLSRRVFFNKVKSLTGQPPVQFVRDIRIRTAAQLLSSGQYIVKEVAYRVGFSDMRYFTQCFKEVFGTTPGQYKALHSGK